MYAQGTELIAKLAFQMKSEGRGRAVVVKVGDKFIVTNTKHSQSNGVKIDRTSKAKIGMGYLLEATQIEQLFDVVQ